MVIRMLAAAQNVQAIQRALRPLLRQENGEVVSNEGASQREGMRPIPAAPFLMNRHRREVIRVAAFPAEHDSVISFISGQVVEKILPRFGDILRAVEGV